MNSHVAKLPPISISSIRPMQLRWHNRMSPLNFRPSERERKRLEIRVSTWALIETSWLILGMVTHMMTVAHLRVDLAWMGTRLPSAFPPSLSPL